MGPILKNQMMVRSERAISVEPITLSKSLANDRMREDEIVEEASRMQIPHRHPVRLALDQFHNGKLECCSIRHW